MKRIYILRKFEVIPMRVDLRGAGGVAGAGLEDVLRAQSIEGALCEATSSSTKPFQKMWICKISISNPPHEGPSFHHG